MKNPFLAVLLGCIALLIGSFVVWPLQSDSNTLLTVANSAELDDEPGFSQDTEEDPTPSMLDGAAAGVGPESMGPVAVEDADEVRFSFYTDVGFYFDEEGRYMIDLLEQDYAYLSVIVTDSLGRPIVGAAPEFSLEGTSMLLDPENVGSPSVTDATGRLDFAVIGGKMGLDKAQVKLGETVGELAVNVISLRANGFPSLPEIDGGLAWSDLMAARISYTEQGISVAFPEQIKDLDDKTVKLTGFMMPLDADVTQRHFLLTSNPPSCFFHIPGGPAGAVEVFSPDGVEPSWNPLVIEGKFELVDSDEYGVIYRLQEARAL
ncbi:MAG: DUF3299 domain-containing protein [Pseudomonadota bacterium]